MKDLIQEGRKIQETFKNTMMNEVNEVDEREKKYWTGIVNHLDTKTKSKKFTNISDYNFVAKDLQSGFGGKLSQSTAMSIATAYGDYRKGTKTIEQFIEDVSKIMTKLRK